MEKRESPKNNCCKLWPLSTEPVSFPISNIQNPLLFLYFVLFRHPCLHTSNVQFKCLLMSEIFIYSSSFLPSSPTFITLTFLFSQHSTHPNTAFHSIMFIRIICHLHVGSEPCFIRLCISQLPTENSTQTKTSAQDTTQNFF